jgi:hypothetical protein
MGKYTVELLDHLEPLQCGLEVAIGSVTLGEGECQLTSLLVGLLNPCGMPSRGRTVFERLVTGERAVAGEIGRQVATGDLARRLPQRIGRDLEGIAAPTCDLSGLSA